MAEVIEYGNIYFFYKPRVEEHQVGGGEEVQRLYVVLSPVGKRRYRLAVLGRKHLPAVGNGGERLWGFVEQVESSPTSLRDTLEEGRYQTRTRGERTQPAARPAGEGVYALVDHGRHTHLSYALELPKEPDEVQHDFNIEEEGSYIISIKNPEQPSPKGAGLRGKRKAALPKRLKEKFRGRRFIGANPPDLMDYEGTEFVLIGAREDASEELGIDLHPEDEDERSAEVFSDLRLRRTAHPTRPLFEGTWE